MRTLFCIFVLELLYKIYSKDPIGERWRICLQQVTDNHPTLKFKGHCRAQLRTLWLCCFIHWYLLCPVIIWILSTSPYILSHYITFLSHLAIFDTLCHIIVDNIYCWLNKVYVIDFISFSSGHMDVCPVVSCHYCQLTVKLWSSCI